MKSIEKLMERLDKNDTVQLSDLWLLSELFGNNPVTNEDFIEFYVMRDDNGDEFIFWNDKKKKIVRDKYDDFIDI